MRSSRLSSPRPLAHSLARFTSAAAMLAALAFASSREAQAQTVLWQGNSNDLVAGDGFLWTTAANWQADTLPDPFADVQFGNGLVGTVVLNGNQSTNSLTFDKSFTLGTYGTSTVLNVETGNVLVQPGQLATINSIYKSNSGLSLTGGGTLYLTNPNNALATGQITITGTGTTLMANLGGMAPQVNGTGSAQPNARQNGPVLGLINSLRTINLQDGGEFKMIGTGANPDGTTFGFNLTNGAGAINVASRFQLLTLDDASQISGIGDLVKNGNGRLTLATQDYNLTGNVIVNGGILDLNRAVNVTVNNVTVPRLSSLAGVYQGNTSTLTVNNGGAVMLNANVGVLDIANVVANNGAILGNQGGDNEYGTRIGTATTLTINGTVSLLARDLLTTTQNRAVRVNSQLLGSGTIEVHGSTGTAAGTLVLQRSDVGSTFDGTIRLLNTARLENNPRNTNVFFGKTLGNATVDLNGFGSVLDLRDSVSGTGAAAVTNTLLNSGNSDYTTVKVTVTTTQAGALPVIAVDRSKDGSTPTSSGNVFNLGSLTMANNRIRLDGVNSYGLAFNTFSVGGKATIELNSSPLLLLGGTTETSAGNGLTLIKRGSGNSAAQDVVSGGVISVSNLEVATGNLQLRGANGSIGKAFGGAPSTVTINGGDAAAGTRGLPTFGVLNLDSNGSSLGIAAANNNDRIDDSAIVNMRSNSVLRLTSANNTQTTETIGTVNVSGHGLIDIVKTGSPTAPVTLTINTLGLTGTKPTVNFTGTALGAAGGNSSRIVIGGQAATPFMGAQYHQNNEWAKYDTTVDTGVAIGVTPFTAADYQIDTAETAWAAGQHLKRSASGTTLTANRTADTLNLQFATANQAVNTNGFVLTLDKGGLLVTTNSGGIIGNNGVGGLTAGSSGPADLYVQSNAQLDIKVPVINNAGADGVFGTADDGVVNFVKSGTGTVRLTHHLLGVGTGNQGGSAQPYTAPTWSSTMTGSWIINDGTLNVQRGQFLNGRPVILNGGTFEINEPVSPANANTILTGWNNDVTVNGNAMIGSDDNGESADAGVGGNSLVKLGSLTINNGSTLGIGSFNGDIAFMGGANFNGKGTINIGVNRAGANHVKIISGAVTGSGFDVVAYGATPETLILGGTSSDTVPNTFTGTMTVYGGTVRLNKANGINAIPDTAAPEDVVINGGTLAWGPGHHGDLSTTNNPNLTNNGVSGLVPVSSTQPFAGVLNAGQNQIADTATITLLGGALGESDRIQNEKWGTLIQKNGTLNVGLGKMEVDVATITGGAFNLNPGGTFKAGTLDLQTGAYSPNITTGLPGDPAKMSTLEVGAGGLKMTGQTIIVGGGSNGAIAGAGAVLKLGGNVTAVDDPLLGNSGTQGIFIQIGNSFRELGNSKTDLLGGNRTFTIDDDVQFFVTTPVTNGGIVKDGGGALVLQPHQASDFAGPVVVNTGVLAARANGAFGTSAGGVTINSGGTVKLESGWTYGDNFTVSGPGAIVPGTTTVREIGALISESGRNRIQGTVSLAGDATIASNGVLNPSATPSVGAGFWTSELLLENPAGITGNGTLTLSGPGFGSIAGGINTTGALNKEGSGRWTISGASTYSGSTFISAGRLRITNNSALGSATAGTTVYGGASLELAGGISVSEPLTLNDGGADSRSGALTSVSGNNTYSGAITVSTDTNISSQAGNLAITGNISAGVAPNNNRSLTLSGAGNGNVSGVIALGTGGLTKSGSGTWSLSGANTFTGATTIAGGNLVLDFTSNNNSKIATGAPLILGGGSLIVQGNAGANTIQSVNGLTLTAGGSTIQVLNGTGRTATLNLGAIDLPLDPFSNLPLSGATVNFALPQGGAITTTTNAKDGILGGYATVGNDWATKSGQNIVAFNAYTPLDLTGQAGFTANARLSSTARLVGGTGVTVNSLKIDGGRGLVMDINSLTLSSGGLIYNGTDARPAIITSAGGTLAAGSADSELFIHTTAGALDIGAPVIGFGQGSLTKAGQGSLFVRNTSGTNYSGSVNINGGTFSINGLGGTHPIALGVQSGNRNVNLNGGTFRVVGGYDLNVTGGQMQMVIGPAGGTIRQEFGGYYNDSNGGFWMNDAGQFSGSGDLTLTGGGRFRIDNNYSGFTGNVTVDASVLRVNNMNSVGGRAEQTITLKANSMLINEVGVNQQIAGLPNNLVLEGGATLVAQNGNRAFLGDIQLNGTNTVAATDRDANANQRELHLMGRISGAGVTLNMIGGSNANPIYLSNSSNDFTGTINLAANTTLEARQMGSLGQAAGDITVNLNGVNSRLLLRNWQNADYRANVVVNNTAEISADRVVNNASGSGQLLSINNLTVNGGDLLQFGGANSYVPHVKGTATFNASPVLNVTNNVLFENGINYSATSGNTLEKRGTGALILRGAANHTGVTLIQAGVVDLRGANGSLPNTSKVELRGGELRIENGDAVNNNRLNDAAAIVLGGGTLRINSDETFTNNVTSVAGNNVVVFNPGSETTTSAITFSNYSRSVGATIQLQAAENGGAAFGALNLGNVRTTPRLIVPALTNTGNANVVPGVFGNNGVDFVQYDGTTTDGGQVLGLRDMRNAGSINSPTYNENEAETGWTDTDIARTTAARTLTANRALDALKVEAAVTIDTAAFNLRIENGGILAVGSAVSLNGTNGSGSVTAGPATPGQGTAELFLGGNNTLTVNANVVNNGTQPVALVKTGTGTVVLASPASTFTGGVFHNSGTLTVNAGTGLGPSTNTITLAGGSLNMFTPTTDSGVILPNFGHNVAVTSNGSSIILDNGTLASGTPGTNNTYAMGKLSINGPYTLTVSGFDSMDMSFNGADFTGSPVIDLAQISGRGNGSILSIGGNITGTGFNVMSSGNTASVATFLNIGNGTPDTTPNTYTGKLVMVNTFPAQQNQPTVQLNKAAGTTAIPGDIEINAGILNWLADDQVADTSKMTLNFGTADFLGKSETLGGLTMRGGALRTNSAGDTSATSSTVTFNGDVDISGTSQTVNSGSLSGTGFEVSSNSTVNITGVLKLSGYSRVSVGATGATLNVGGLEMTGAAISQLSNVGGANIVRLNGDVTTFASEVPALLGNSNDSDTFLELNGTRTFTVADGPAGEDLLVSTVIRNPAGGESGIIKNGPGTVEFRGGGTANSYTGPTTINEGTLVLFRSANANSIGSSVVTVGDGVGGAKADKLVVRSNQQINDTADLTVSASGVLDLDTFNTSEQIGSLSGNGAVDLGPNSTLTVGNLLNKVFSGIVSGGGGVTKLGEGTQELSGANDYLGQTTINAGTLVLNGSVGGITTVGGTLSPANGPGLLNVRGDFDLQTGATLKIELGGTTAGTGYDRLNVTGAITLAGDLQGSLINGFNGSIDLFFIMINDGIDAVNGTFNGLPEGSLVNVSGKNFFITYAANFEAANGPSLAGGNDIALVVPEPTTGVSLLAGVGSLLGLKRFRRRQK